MKTTKPMKFADNFSAIYGFTKIAHRCTNEEKKLWAESVAGRLDDLTTACKELLALVDDFMPNVGHCAIQNYQRLNDAPILARKAIAKAERDTR